MDNLSLKIIQKIKLFPSPSIVSIEGSLDYRYSDMSFHCFYINEKEPIEIIRTEEIKETRLTKLSITDWIIKTVNEISDDYKVREFIDDSSYFMVGSFDDEEHDEDEIHFKGNHFVEHGGLLNFLYKTIQEEPKNIWYSLLIE